jgi:hypothetical protein
MRLRKESACLSPHIPISPRTVVRLLPQMNSTAPRLHGSTAPRLHGSTAPRLIGGDGFGRSAVASRNNGDVFWIHRSAPCGDSRARRDDGKASRDHRSAPLGHRRARLELPSHTREGSQGALTASHLRARRARPRHHPAHPRPTSQGNAVLVGWGWQGNSAFLDLLEIQVDRGDGKGWVFLT